MEVKPVSKQNEDFFEQVYQVVEQIPEGRVTSYGAIAQFLSAKRAARMVGWALNQCILHRKNLPAHRVVNRVGQLSGKFHFGEPDLMQKRLENEGIVIENDKVKAFDKLFWDPSIELRID